MLVVSQIKDQALSKKTVDKLLFAMAKPKVSLKSLTAFPNAASKDRILIYVVLLLLNFITLNL